jgi:hypothetical protein
MAELARHRIDFTFLRRSFKKDIVDRNVKKEIGLIKKTWESMKRRTPDVVERDHAFFVNNYFDD